MHRIIGICLLVSVSIPVLVGFFEEMGLVYQYSVYEPIIGLFLVMFAIWGGILLVRIKPVSKKKTKKEEDK